MSPRRVNLVATAALVVSSACTSTRASTSEIVHFDTVPPTTAPAPTTRATSTPVATTSTTEVGVTDPTLAARGPVALPAFDAVVESFLRAKGALGASVAIAKGGRLMYVRAYGARSRITDDPVTVSSRFDLASVSKVFAAAAVMRLVDAGRLHLDDKLLAVVGDRLTLPAGYDPRLADTTIGQLLGHTSGVRENPPMGPVGSASCIDTITHALSRPFSVSPGTFLYSNVNYCLLGVVLEAVLHVPWETAVHQLVLDPAGAPAIQLAHTGMVGPNDVDHRSGLGPTGDNPTYLEALGPGAQWAGTAADVVRVLDALDPNRAGGADLLSPGALAAMTARPSAAMPSLDIDSGAIDGAPAAGEGPPASADTPTTAVPAGRWYGLGLMTWDGGASWGHSGSLPMARNLAIHEADGTTWCILVYGSFDDHADALLRTMHSAMATVIDWPGGDLGPAVP
ncbi:MAG: D-alanyl-D-alanine carboxypeptidase [Acidimicrobiaceae bacterium]|nr:D-alanyl-D-alanine carboxypeptidase [Acidimicrobiaceae bacterium]